MSNLKLMGLLSWQLMLIEILKSERHICISDVAKKVGVFFSHAHNITKELEKLNFIIKQRVGRKNHIILTKQGEEIARRFRYIQAIMEEA